MKMYKSIHWQLLLREARKKAHIEPSIFFEHKCRDNRAWNKFYKLAQKWGFTIGDFVYGCLNTYQGLCINMMVSEESLDPEGYWFPDDTVKDIVEPAETVDIEDIANEAWKEHGSYDKLVV